MKFIGILKKFPYVQALQSGTLMGCGDLVSQCFIEKKQVKDFEWIRTARFFGIGFVLVAPTLRAWYGVLDKKFGSATKIAALKKVALDQSLFAPGFLGVFICALGATQMKSPAEIKVQIQKDYIDILLMNWTVWPAVQICNFAFIPLQHQVLAVQFVALFWNTYLAWKTNREKAENLAVKEK